MELHVMDEVFTPGAAGVVLLCMDEQNAAHLRPGMALEDALGNRHIVSAAAYQQEGLYTIHIAGGKPEYFERLFRNVKVDALTMHFDPEE